MTTSFSWGTDAFGIGPWGGVLGLSGLQLVSALAIRENEVQLTFNIPPLFSRPGVATDASRVTAYSILPLGGSPSDGSTTRAVSVLKAVRGTSDLTVNLWLDRVLSPFSAEYEVLVSGITSEGDEVLDTRATFYGLRAGEDSSPDPVPLAKDFAHPDTLQAQLDPLPTAGDAAGLGGIPLDASGDYATDDGLVSLRKRIFRRLLTRKGAFSHLPSDYGLSLRERVKKLGRARDVQLLASETELQVLKEPEVLKCRANIVQSKKAGLWNLSILVQTKEFGAVKFEQELISG